MKSIHDLSDEHVDEIYVACQSAVPDLENLHNWLTDYELDVPGVKATVLGKAIEALIEIEQACADEFDRRGP